MSARLLRIQSALTQMLQRGERFPRLVDTTERLDDAHAWLARMRPARPQRPRIRRRRRRLCAICGFPLLRGLPRFRNRGRIVCNVCDWARQRLEGSAR